MSFRKRGRPARNIMPKVTDTKSIYDSFYCLGLPNNSKKCICMICNQMFYKIAHLRKHLSIHMTDPLSFDNIDLQSKPELFDAVSVNLSTHTNTSLLRIIQQQLELGENHRFYQVVNSSAWELDLDASETESETDEFLVNEWMTPLHEYRCSSCSGTFDRVHKIVSHMKNEHNASDMENVCTHCRRVFPNSAILEKHLRLQCENKFKSITCSRCQVRFMWQSSHDEHVRIMHSAETIKSAVAMTRTKSSDVSLKIKSFMCDICSKGFIRSEHLERHRKIHVPSEKKFSCDLCKKKFNRKDNLK